MAASRPHSIHPATLFSLGLLTLCLGFQAQAQEFDFTPADQAPAQPQPLPTAPNTLSPPPVSPGSVSDGNVPTMPVLTQPQTGSAPIQPVPSTTANPATVPTAPPATQPPVVSIPAASQPLAPTQPQTVRSATAYSYQRREGASPSTVGPVSRGQLPAGTVIPLTVYREFSFPPFKAINSNLEVPEPVLDQLGQVVIPAGSTIWGTFEPIYKIVERRDDDDDAIEPQFDERIEGTRFVANRVTVQNSTYLMSGETEILPTGLDPNADVPQTALKGAGYGVAGGVVLGVVTGGLGLAPLLAGSLAGAAAGTTNVDRMVTLTPSTIIYVELTQDLIIQ